MCDSGLESVILLRVQMSGVVCIETRERPLHHVVVFASTGVLRLLMLLQLVYRRHLLITFLLKI